MMPENDTNNPISTTSAASRDPELLTVALHWAETIENNLPPKLGRRWKCEIEAAMPYVPGERVIREDDHGDPVY